MENSGNSSNNEQCRTKIPLWEKIVIVLGILYIISLLFPAQPDGICDIAGCNKEATQKVGDEVEFCLEHYLSEVLGDEWFEEHW